VVSYVRLFDDAESKMRDPRCHDHPGALELNCLRAQVVEQSDTRTQQDGYQIDMDFI
jgi:hypothetical protein